MFHRHPYSAAHAALGAAALCLTVFMGGFAAFWRNFIHGANMEFDPARAMSMLLVSTVFYFALFGVLLLAGRVFPCRKEIAPPPAPPMPRARAALFALRLAPFLTAATIGLGLAGSKLLELALGTAPSDQDLVKCFTSPAATFSLKAAIAAFVLAEAPVLEELVFRGVIFRGAARDLPFLPAALASSFVFALAHVNAATFPALMFLGSSFAWLYRRTGSILAPMTAHAFFNAANLAMLFIFPDL